MIRVIPASAVPPAPGLSRLVKITGLGAGGGRTGHSKNAACTVQSKVAASSANTKKFRIGMGKVFKPTQQL
jgi:hypothetical protein